MYFLKTMRVMFGAAAMSASAAVAQSDTISHIAPNDNQIAAGRLLGGTLHVELEARMGIWFPEGRQSVGLKVAAFAESGKPLQNPGPIIRVPTGTHVSILLHNTLAKTLTVRGLGRNRGMSADSVRIEPGASQVFEFDAGTPGTYYYAGLTGRSNVFSRGEEDSQLNGAIVVEALNAKPHPERVFLISWWYRLDGTSPTGIERVTMAINGRSWPHTEPLKVLQGDSVHWRWINMTTLNHPMHLHGFYYRVDGVGDGSQYTTYAPGARRHVVTELMQAGRTMDFTWSPTRPGNWLLHCHVAMHMSHLASIGTEHGIPRLSESIVPKTHAHGAAGERKNGNADARVQSAGAAHIHTPRVEPAKAEHGMAGLVMGIYVAPRGKPAPRPSNHRPLRLTIGSKPNVFGAHAGYRYTLGNTIAEADSSTFGMAGPTLMLKQHEPVAITIVNRSHEPAAVHWHGIELESFPDGVPGFSGHGKSLLPAVAPGDSITVRFTPTRAGTFMYHSHYNEIEQISSGLHGAIVVLPPEQKWNPVTDRVLLFSDNGPTENQITGPFPATRLNGKVQADTLQFRTGVTYRLRLINIRTDYTLTVALMNFVLPMQWKPVAKDGADLPSGQAVSGSARITFGPGEIHDVEFTPTQPGTYVLQYSMSELPPPFRLHTTVPVIVR
ncbi:MAG: multicopper oxidase domain-containing protein [Phycisphaerae bacterium]|nr:multicopper oxidase domain-containing protein [Gemmatimonadaceae bacterium]